MHTHWTMKHPEGQKSLTPNPHLWAQNDQTQWALWLARKQTHWTMKHSEKDKKIKARKQERMKNPRRNENNGHCNQGNLSASTYTNKLCCETLGKQTRRKERAKIDRQKKETKKDRMKERKKERKADRKSERKREKGARRVLGVLT